MTIKAKWVREKAEVFDFNEAFDEIWPDYINIEDVLEENGLEDKDEIDDEDYVYYLEHNNGEAQDDTIYQFITEVLELPRSAVVEFVDFEEGEGKEVPTTLFDYVKQLANLP